MQGTKVSTVCYKNSLVNATSSENVFMMAFATQWKDACTG